jgi:hypothetical protein
MAHKAIALAALLILVGGVEQAWAQGKGAAKTATAALLPVGVKGLPPETAKALGAVVLKELGELGVFEAVPGKNLSDAIKALKAKKVYGKGCEDKKACMQAVGRGAKANVLFHLRVAKAQEGVTLTMKAFDVKSGKEVRKGTEFATEDSADLERAARWVTRKVSSPFITQLAKGKGKLQIDCAEGGADLYVNGKSFGKKAGTGFKVSSGVFDVVVKKEGFQPFHDVVIIRPDEELVVKAELKPTGESKPLVADAGTGTPGSTGTTGGQPTTPPTPPPDKKDDKKDLPAWAIFETTKPAGTAGTAGAGKTQTDGGKAAGAMPWQQPPKKEEPFLPEKEGKPGKPDKPSREKKFYQTWWFWTVVGVVVAGGAGTGIYFGIKGTGGGGGTGSAVVSWQ